MSLAGTPATTALAGTSLVPTASAPTIAPSPIVTPGTTVTAAPSHTLQPIVIGAGSMSARVGPGRRDDLRVVNVLPCPMSVPSPMLMPPASWKRHPMLMKTFSPKNKFLPNSL